MSDILASFLDKMDLPPQNQFIGRIVILSPKELLESSEHQTLANAISMINEGKEFYLKGFTSTLQSQMVSRSLSKTGNNKVHTSLLLGLCVKSIQRADRLLHRNFGATK